MAETDLIWLTLLVFMPSLFALVLLFFPRGWEKAMCWWSLAGTAVTLGLAVAVFINYKVGVIDRAGVMNTKEERQRISLEDRTARIDRAEADTAEINATDYVARRPWIERFNIDYFVGIDGISLALILLTALLFVLSMIPSFHIKRYEGTERFVRGYCILFLILETGVLGSFVALDFFLFYIFWEVMLLPMYFLIGIWGGPRREYAAIKFFLYTLLGSVFILIAMLGFYFSNLRDFVSPRTVDREVERIVLERTGRSEKDALAGQPLDRERAKAARKEVKVSTFDLTALARAGKGALQYLGNDKDVKKVTTAPALQGARDVVANLTLIETLGPEQKEARAEVEARRKEIDRDAIKKQIEALEKKASDAKKDAEKNKINAEVAALKKKLEPLTRAEATLADVEKKAQKAELDLKDAYDRAGPNALNPSERSAAAASKKIAELEAGLKERLESEWFFRPNFQIIMFIFLLIGFAIKVPVFPFHTWLPDAHVEAPTPISMILAGILLKLGGYGIIRIAYPICPWAAEHLALWVASFGVINIVYGAFAAMAQTDFKKLVAYSSISHMGYVLLGIAVWSTPENSNSWSLGMNGAMFQMIAHGVTSAGMFFLVGVIYDRAHHRNLDNFRGLYEPMPMYGGLSAVIFFAAMGLPGMCGFIGEVMVVLSVWKFAPGGQQWVGITFSVLSALTVVLTAGYILWTIQRVFMGTNPTYKNYKDVTMAELACAVPIVILSVALGVLPQLLVLNWMEPSVTQLVDTLVSYK
jgi:NADH:ubiquinone oxidoreductase subunit 4 (subunit M)